MADYHDYHFLWFPENPHTQLEHALLMLFIKSPPIILQATLIAYISLDTGGN